MTVFFKSSGSARLGVVRMAALTIPITLQSFVANAGPCTAPIVENRQAYELMDLVYAGSCDLVPRALDAVRAQHAAIDRMRAACPDAAKEHPDTPGSRDMAALEQRLRQACGNVQKFNKTMDDLGNFHQACADHDSALAQFLQNSKPIQDQYEATASSGKCSIEHIEATRARLSVFKTSLKMSEPYAQCAMVSALSGAFKESISKFSAEIAACDANSTREATGQANNNVSVSPLSSRIAPPPPTVVVQGMQTGSPNQQAGGSIANADTLRTPQGSCSDITGVGGGGGQINCQQSSPIPPGLQAQIAKARSYSQGANPGYSNLQKALEQYLQIEAAFRTDDDLANAEIAAEQVRTLDALLARPNGESCPKLGDAQYWQDPAYCRSANCFERGTAYYGMLCLADTHEICSARLDAINLRGDRRSLSNAQVAELMATGSPRCMGDGTPMTFQQTLQWGLRHKGWSDASTP